MIFSRVEWSETFLVNMFIIIFNLHRSSGIQARLDAK
ncbi:hypothetical protein COMNV_01224 [Commensalibacter sp. Nvir]|nr:hypothetical protein COMNV_01224 [Commensalibacter sp. Nvir]